MDEVPVANANPVNTIINKPEGKNNNSKQSQIVLSLKNLVYMAPLALILCIQIFYLGSSFGKFTTLPYTSFTTFVFFASFAVLLFCLQLLLRSMVYSTLVGVFLVAGIFYSWFGDFYRPIIDNFQSIGMIVKSAWSRKDIPFPLLMSGIMTFSLAGTALIQFFVSLFVKSFFETFFGRSWGDGKWMGFVGAMALVAGIHGGFFLYSSSAANTQNKLDWAIFSRYKPIEKYLTLTPGATMLGTDRIYSSHNGNLNSIDIKTGRIRESRPFNPAVIRPYIEYSSSPVFFNEREIVCFNSEMNLQQWSTRYPDSFPGLQIDESQTNTFIPLTAFLIGDGKKLLVFYDYGFTGLYDMENGKKLWLSSVDRKTPVKRHFSDFFPGKEYFFVGKDRIVFSCQNGIVKAIGIENGEELWSYTHENSKYNGKPQRAFLSGQSNRVLASFDTGEMITLALENGQVMYQARNEAFSFVSAPSFKGIEASFLTKEGFFYIVEVDGGRILYSCNLLPRKLDFLPIVHDLKRGIIAHKNEVLRVDKQKAKPVIKVKNKVFVTRPVFDDKIMYMGTQDGWIYCVHSGSQHEKWRIHINGELDENSLAILGGKLIVQTRSGSIMAIDRRF